MPEHEPVANERTIPGLSMAAFDPRNPTRVSLLGRTEDNKEGCQARAARQTLRRILLVELNPSVHLQYARPIVIWYVRNIARMKRRMSKQHRWGSLKVEHGH